MSKLGMSSKTSEVWKCPITPPLPGAYELKYSTVDVSIILWSIKISHVFSFNRSSENETGPLLRKARARVAVQLVSAAATTIPVARESDGDAFPPEEQPIKDRPGRPGGVLLVRRPRGAHTYRTRKYPPHDHKHDHGFAARKMHAPAVLLVAAFSAVARAAIIRTGGVELRKYDTRVLLATVACRRVTLKIDSRCRHNKKINFWR